MTCAALWPNLLAGTIAIGWCPSVATPVNERLLSRGPLGACLSLLVTLLLCVPCVRPACGAEAAEEAEPEPRVTVQRVVVEGNTLEFNATGVRGELFRVEVIGPAGRRAWTQPFFLSGEEVARRGPVVGQVDAHLQVRDP